MKNPSCLLVWILSSNLTVISSACSCHLIRVESVKEIGRDRVFWWGGEERDEEEKKKISPSLVSRKNLKDSKFALACLCSKWPQMEGKWLLLIQCILLYAFLSSERVFCAFTCIVLPFVYDLSCISFSLFLLAAIYLSENISLSTVARFWLCKRLFSLWTNKKNPPTCHSGASLASCLATFSLFFCSLSRVCTFSSLPTGTLVHSLSLIMRAVVSTCSGLFRVPPRKHLSRVLPVSGCLVSLSFASSHRSLDAAHFHLLRKRSCLHHLFTFATVNGCSRTRTILMHAHWISLKDTYRRTVSSVL